MFGALRACKRTFYWEFRCGCCTGPFERLGTRSSKTRSDATRTARNGVALPEGDDVDSNREHHDTKKLHRQGKEDHLKDQNEQVPGKVEPFVREEDRVVDTIVPKESRWG